MGVQYKRLTQILLLKLLWILFYKVDFSDSLIQNEVEVGHDEVLPDHNNNIPAVGLPEELRDVDDAVGGGHIDPYVLWI